MSDSRNEGEGRYGAAGLGAIAAIALAAFYACGRVETPVAAKPPPIPMTVVVIEGWPDLGGWQRRTLPGSCEIVVPERGMEGRFLSFIEDPNAPVTKTAWFDFDRLLFDSDKATLRAESHEQLGNIAQVLKAFPAVEVKVGGYTDNTGAPEHNLKLSQDRADAVKIELIRLGVVPSRIASEGYGEKYPMGDNATEEGRARNRRTAILVTKK